MENEKKIKADIEEIKVLCIASLRTVFMLTWNYAQRSVYGVVASRRVLCTIHIVVCRFYFLHFVFSVGEKALCNRTKEDCNVLELALALFGNFIQFVFKYSLSIHFVIKWHTD